ncbi:ABC transporter permease [Tepidibacillus marianensis]|uniref:ABC transporter permease n=1 Tax=Tepidibacillus marianensis TaxID=3131995 RepID=UPI0030CAD8F3
MRTIWTIALWKTKWFLKAKSSWVNLFLLPIIFTLIFGGFGGSNQSNNQDVKAQVSFVPSTTQINQKMLEDVLGHQLDAKMVAYPDREAAIQAMKKDQISAVVLWEDHFENTWSKLKPTTWTLVYEKQSAENFMREQQMKQLIIGLNALPMMGQDTTLSPKVQVEHWLHIWQDYRESIVKVKVQYGTQEGNNSFSRIFVAFTIMFLMFALNQAAGTILEEKEAGTWNRMLLAPLSKSQLILGNILHFLMLGWFQFVTMMLFSHFAFDVYWGSLLDTVLYITLVILTFSGLGFLLATFVRTPAQQNIIGSVVVTLTSMLGGLYWPLSMVSETMRKIGNFMPQKWAMEGLMQLMSGGYRLVDVTNSIFFMAVFLITFYIIGLIRVRKI